MEHTKTWLTEKIDVWHTKLRENVKGTETFVTMS